MSPQIEIGKFYRTTYDTKVKCVGDYHRFVFAVCDKETGACSDIPRLTSDENGCQENGILIVSEWNDKPEADWSKLPAWANWVAMDKTGTWWWSECAFSMTETPWHFGSGAFGRIPMKHHPKFTGDWKDSLVERPKKP